MPKDVKLIRLLENLLKAIDKAHDFEGDVFGSMHNDVIDYETEAKRMIEKLKKD